MAASDMPRLGLAGLIVLLLTPTFAAAQSAGEVERCFQNPAGCPSSAPSPPPPAAAPPPRAAAPADYSTVLRSPDPERRKLQESLRTLDKYHGPIDGKLQSEASEKAIADWQRGHGYTAVGKLTPSEAVALNNEAARVPIKRINPSTASAAPAPSPASAGHSNADELKALQARLAERHKAAEPKAEAAAQSLVKDLKAYIADGNGAAGEQFAVFARWYADNKAAGRTFGDVGAAVEDYGDAKAGAAAIVEATFQTKQGEKTYPQCMMFAWIDSSPRKETEAFSCDDVAGLEKWKTDHALKSAWR
jgi:hypothetical protein